MINRLCRYLLGGMARAIVAAVAPLPSVLAQTAISIDERIGETDGWRIGYTRNFAGCVAHTTFTDNTTVWIGYGPGIEFYVALSNPVWRSLENGSTYRLSVKPAGAGNWKGDFLAFERGGEKGLVTSGLKREFLLDFAKASAMTVQAGERTVTRVSLAGSRNALTQMMQCQTAHAERSRADANAAQEGRSQSKERSGSGTGFFVSSTGHVITNHHVVEKCSRLDVSYVGRPPEKATVLATDAKNDLALITTSLKPQAVASFRSRVRVGESIYVYGFPLTGLLASTGNFTTGNITAIAGLADDTSKVQISAPVQPGNSGGPLMDKRGNIVGVIVSKLKNEFAQNANFAIKSSIAETFLEANGVQPVTTERSTDMDGADIADQAKAFTVYVVCNRPS